MPPVVCHFLLVYDLKKGRLLTQKEFADPVEAAAAYSQAELEHRGEDDLEIVLVGADSIETIMRTHGHYFTETLATPGSQFLAGV